MPVGWMFHIYFRAGGECVRGPFEGVSDWVQAEHGLSVALWLAPRPDGQLAHWMGGGGGWEHLRLPEQLWVLQIWAVVM